MARPKKDINWHIVDQKMEAGCTAKEIYENVCDPNTFYNRFKEHYGKAFADCSDDYYSIGNGLIKHVQYLKAINGNIPMLCLLGKERLGQGKEKESHSPYEDLVALRHENMILKAQLDRLINKELDENKPKTE